MTFDLDINDDISITIDRIIMYHISNKMSANQQKRPHVNSFICIEMARHYRRVVKRKNDTFCDNVITKTRCYPVLPLFFQIARISTIFKLSSCILYDKNPFFHTYNLQQTACRYLKKCALESLLKTGHWSETPGILKYSIGYTSQEHRESD